MNKYTFDEKSDTLKWMHPISFSAYLAVRVVNLMSSNTWSEVKQTHKNNYTVTGVFGVNVWTQLHQWCPLH